VSSNSIGIVTHFLNSSTLDLKWNNDYEVKVQTVRFDLRVFPPISSEQFWKYSTFCTWSLHFMCIKVFGIWSDINSTQWLHQGCDSTDLSDAFAVFFGCVSDYFDRQNKLMAFLESLLL
jgi:hypothetical protein